MTSILSNLFFSSASRKTLVYYGGYCLLFLLSYLALVSTISFFHFLLDHEMRVIESWLTRNAWETLVLAKLAAAVVVLKTLRLNNYLIKDSLGLIKKSELLPERRACALILFLAVFYVALIYQFGEAVPNESGVQFATASYFGSIAFYLIDFFVIFTLLTHNPLSRRRQKFLLCALLPVMFLVSAKSAMPYIDKQSIFLALHFGAMTALLSKGSNNLANLALYSLLIVGPMSLLFGVDLVWADSHSVYVFPEQTPFIGILLIWLTGFIYYFRSNRPA